MLVYIVGFMAWRKSSVRDSLKASFKDGVFASVMLGVMDHYVIPFALFLGAGAQQVGWVSALPNLLGSVSQLFAVPAVYWIGGRLKFLIRAVTSQASFLLAIACLALIDFPGRVAAFLLLLILFTVSGGLAGPAWGSLMTDYVPKRLRGQYFGWRSGLLGFVNLGSVIMAGLLLSLFKGSRLSGFFVIFLIGAAARFVSAFFIARMRETRRKRDPANDFTFLEFVARFRESNFLKFVFFVAGLTFATYLSAPFFAVFMLRELGFSYFVYMALQVSSAGAGLIAVPLWGKHADLVGNVRVMRLTGFCTALIPMLWLFSHHVGYLVMVQLFSGFMWSGMTLCASNFIYDAVTPQKRVRCIGYFNVINGTALFLGASVGGFLASRLPPLWGHSLLTLFALSSVARLIFYLSFAYRFREVRAAQEVSSHELFFSLVGIRPLIGSPRDETIRPVRNRD